MQDCSVKFMRIRGNAEIGLWRGEFSRYAEPL